MVLPDTVQIHDPLEVILTTRLFPESTTITLPLLSVATPAGVLKVLVLLLVSLVHTASQLPLELSFTTWLLLTPVT